jgi:PST family polysaccharide transporter
MAIPYLPKRFTQANALIGNTSWMLLAEGAARASRLITIIALASYLSASDYGTAMLALVCYELLRVLTRLGAGAAIIQCTQEQLGSTTGNARLLNWSICLAIALFQYFFAPVLADFYQQPLLEPLLQIMAFSYVIYPIVMVRACLVQRSNNMKYFALCSALAVMTDNLSTALLVYLGFGVYAVAWAKIIAALVWLGMFLTAKVPSIKSSFCTKTILGLLVFSSKVLASDFLKTGRSQIDVLLAGKLLAPELFGLYSFAKSAGVGLGQSLSNAYLSCIYPRMASLHREQKLSSEFRPIFLLALAISSIFIIQSLMAPIYIPLLFNNDWPNPSILVTVLCLSAIPCLFVDISALKLRIQYQTNKEIALQAASVVSLLLSLIVFAPTTPLGFAICTVAVSFSWLLFLPVIFKINHQTKSQQ